MRKIVCCAVATTLVGLSVATPAQAETVRPGNRGITTVGKGVKELGFENLLVTRYEATKVELVDPLAAPGTEPKESTVSRLNIGYTGFLTFRYFLKDNMALGLNAGGFYRATTDKVTDVPSTDPAAPPGTTKDQTDTFTDVGGIGFIMFNYYVRLNNSIFFKPGIGAGGFYGTRSRPVANDPSLEQKSDLMGGAGRLDIGAAFFTSQQFNLKAGIDVIALFGIEKAKLPANAPPDAEDPKSQSFTAVDVGFNVGLGYVF